MNKFVSKNSESKKLKSLNKRNNMYINKEEKFGEKKILAICCYLTKDCNRLFSIFSFSSRSLIPVSVRTFN